MRTIELATAVEALQLLILRKSVNRVRRTLLAAVLTVRPTKFDRLQRGAACTYTWLSVQCNAWHWIDIKSLECMSVCVSVCPKYLSSSIATAAFVRSSSNWNYRSHIWQQRLSSMANYTGSSTWQFTSGL